LLYFPSLRVHCSIPLLFLFPLLLPSIPHTCVPSVSRPCTWLFTTEQHFS
jgi:hypothetical protein